MFRATKPRSRGVFTRESRVECELRQPKNETEEKGETSAFAGTDAKGKLVRTKRTTIAGTRVKEETRRPDNGKKEEGEVYVSVVWPITLLELRQLAERVSQKLVELGKLEKRGHLTPSQIKKKCKTVVEDFVQQGAETPMITADVYHGFLKDSEKYLPKDEF